MPVIKFLHCADIHLDAPFTSLGADVEKSSIRRQDLKKTFQAIINAAKEQKVDIILISGDLYEQNYIKKSTISFINEKFNEIPDIKVFIVPGNHDPYIINSYYKNFKWSENVYILTEENPYMVFENMQTCVYGIGFKSFYEEKSLIYNIKPINPDFVNILLVHGTVDMNFKQSNYNPMTSESLCGLDMDYIALGHFHNRIDNVGNKGVVYNPGSPEPLGFDETGEHGFYIGTLTKSDATEKSLEIEFKSHNEKYYQNIEVNVSKCNNDEQIAGRIDSSIREYVNKVFSDKSINTDMDEMDAFVRRGIFLVLLKGYVEEGFKANPAHILSHFNDKVFLIKIKDETVGEYNFDEIMKETGLRGLFSRKIFLLINKTEDEHEKKLLMNALYYGIEALDKGKVDIF